MTELPEEVTTIDPGEALWEQVFVVSPLVLVGTREQDGEYDLAPKHMATPVGFEGYFAFVCTREHRTYWNARREAAFTVSYPLPTEVVLTSLTATPRCDDRAPKPEVRAIATFPATVVDGILVRDAYLYLECELDRIIDGFGSASLVVGRIVAAHARDTARRRHDRDDQDVIGECPLLAYLSPGRHAAIDRSQSFPFPAGLEEDR